MIGQLTTHPMPAVEGKPGTPVLLLHGFCSSSSQDFARTGWPEDLAAAGHPSYAVDLPGHGDSPAVSSPDDGRTDSVVSALVRVIEQVIRASAGDQLDVIGYSLGARLAWELPNASGAVRRLVLGGISPAEPFADVDLDQLRSAAAGNTPASPMIGMFAGMITAPGLDAASLINLIGGLGSEPFDPNSSPPKVPTMIIAGADDPMSQGVESLVDVLPEGSLHRVPGDHRGALDGPEFRRAAVDFLSD